MNRFACSLVFAALLSVTACHASAPPASSTGGDIGDPNSPLIKALIASHNHPSTQTDRATTPLAPDPQRVVYFVRPQDTDGAIDQFLQDHYVLYNKAVPQNGHLFVFFPGTFGRPHDYQFLLNEAANLGYKVIGLEYPDDTENPAASAVEQICANAADPSCADHVRAERLTGMDAASPITVTPANSILNRLLKLLSYLQQQHPEEGWGSFVHDDQIQWNRIALGGHSQGSGFAAFIAKQHLVARVALWSGPSDYSTHLHAFAPWMHQPSATPLARYYGLIHRQEPTASGIVAGWQVLGMAQFGPPTVGNLSPSPAGGSHELVVTLPPHMATTAGDAYHGSTASDSATPRTADGQPAYQNVWAYLLTAS